MRLLFVCGRNRRRSPTAERIFSEAPGVDVDSAGLNSDADTPLSADLIEWAEVIFVMDAKQKAKLSRMFSSRLRGKRVVSLRIPDDYEYMDPELVRLLWERAARLIPALASARRV
jgi:predicted protein tyrosine phosphatase